MARFQNPTQGRDFFGGVFLPPNSCYSLPRPNVSNHGDMSWYDITTGAPYNPSFDATPPDAIYGKPDGPVDGAAWYKNPQSGTTFWRIPLEALADGWDPTRPSTQQNHPAKMTPAEIAQLPGSPSQQADQQQQRGTEADYQQQRAELQRQRQQLQRDAQLQRERQQLERDRQQLQGAGDGTGAGAGGDDLFGNMFGAGDGTGDDLFGGMFGAGGDNLNSDGGSDMGGLLKFMQQMMGFQFTMQIMQQMMGSFGGGMMGAGGGGNGAGIAGALLEKTNANSLVTSGTGMKSLTFTTAGATGPEVAAFRDKVVAALQGYGLGQGNAATVQALTAPGGSNGSNLAIALLPAPTT